MTDCLFITGGTGFIGQRLIARLRATQPGRRIVALVRDASRAAHLTPYGVELIVGDVTRPQLGLSAADSARLASEVTQIIHSAGEINFGAALPVARAANVFGVQQAINFARRCPKLKRFAHLSTISIHGLRPGPLLEEPSPAGHRFVNSYQQSKHEAEWVVLRATREVPAEIFRISLIGADSIAGAVSQFNYVHHLLRYLPNSPMPVMPGDPDTCVDLIPADWLIEALAYLFDHRFCAGAIRNLSAGPAGSLAFADAIGIASEVMEKHLRSSVRLPRLVSIEEFQRRVAESPDHRLREAAAVIGPHVKLLSARQSFPNTRAVAELDGEVPPPAPLRSWFAPMIDYCLRSNWGENSGAWSMIGSRAPDTILAT